MVNHSTSQEEEKSTYAQKTMTIILAVWPGVEETSLTVTKRLNGVSDNPLYILKTSGKSA